MRYEFFDIWEKWGRHIWGKGVVRILFLFSMCAVELRPDLGEGYPRHVSWQMTYISTVRVSKMCMALGALTSQVQIVLIHYAYGICSFKFSFGLVH